MSAIPSAGLPTRAILHPAGLYLALQQIPVDELRDAFMEQTIVRMQAPKAFVQINPADVGKAHPATAPAGIVFHVGRCGSTVVSQSLRQHEGVVVYSEPRPFNEILAAAHAWPRAARVAALRTLAAAFAAHAQKPYVVKLSSWSTLFCDVVAEAFPDTHWAFCIRDPVEVGEAIVRNPPPWFRGDAEQARPIIAAVDPENLSDSAEDFFGRLYGAFCDAVLRIDRRTGVLVRYEQIPGAVVDIVAPHFALSLDETQRERILLSTGSYAKAPLSTPTAFVPDGASKRAAASPALLAAIDAFARPSLARLDQAFAAR